MRALSVVLKNRKGAPPVNLSIYWKERDVPTFAGAQKKMRRGCSFDERKHTQSFKSKSAFINTKDYTRNRTLRLQILSFPGTTRITENAPSGITISGYLQCSYYV